MIGGNLGIAFDVAARIPLSGDYYNDCCEGAVPEDGIQFEVIHLYGQAANFETPFREEDNPPPEFPDVSGFSNEVYVDYRYPGLTLLYNDCGYANRIDVETTADGYRLTPVPGKGYYFSRWEGDITGSEYPLDVRLGAASDKMEYCNDPYSDACGENALVRGVFRECTYVKVVPWIMPNLEYWEGPCGDSDRPYRFDGSERYRSDDWTLAISGGTQCIRQPGDTWEDGVKMVEVRGQRTVQLDTDSAVSGYTAHSWQHRADSGEPVRWFADPVTVDASENTTLHVLFGKELGSDRTLPDGTIPPFLPPMVKEALTISTNGAPEECLVKFGHEGCVASSGHRLPFVIPLTDTVGSTYNYTYTELFREPDRPQTPYRKEAYAANDWFRFQIDPLPGWQFNNGWNQGAGVFIGYEGLEVGTAGDIDGTNNCAFIDLPSAGTNRSASATLTQAPTQEVKATTNDITLGRAFLLTEPTVSLNSTGCPDEFASGTYLPGETIQAFAWPKKCMTFSHWEDADGTLLGYERLLEYTLPTGKTGESILPLLVLTAVHKVTCDCRDQFSECTPTVRVIMTSMMNAACAGDVVVDNLTDETTPIDMTDCPEDKTCVEKGSFPCGSTAKLSYTPTNGVIMERFTITYHATGEIETRTVLQNGDLYPATDDRAYETFEHTFYVDGDITINITPGEGNKVRLYTWLAKKPGYEGPTPLIIVSPSGHESEDGNYYLFNKDEDDVELRVVDSENPMNLIGDGFRVWEINRAVQLLNPVTITNISRWTNATAVIGPPIKCPTGEKTFMHLQRRSITQNQFGAHLDGESDYDQLVVYEKNARLGLDTCFPLVPVYGEFGAPSKCVGVTGGEWTVGCSEHNSWGSTEDPRHMSRNYTGFDIVGWEPWAYFYYWHKLANDPTRSECKFEIYQQMVLACPCVGGSQYYHKNTLEADIKEGDPFNGIGMVSSKRQGVGDEWVVLVK